MVTERRERPTLRVISQPRSTAFFEMEVRRHAVGVIGHAGLAAHRAGGAPTRVSLRRALRLGVDVLEVDLVVTSDQAIVLHHDLRIPLGVPVVELTLDDLRRIDPQILTLDEAMEEVGGSVPVVLDLKSAAVVRPLCEWLGVHASQFGVSVCSEQARVLEHVSGFVPEVPLWRTFPDIGARLHQRLKRVAVGLMSHRGAPAVRMAADFWVALGQAPACPRDALARIAGLPWRNLLPGLMASVHAHLGVRGVTVHHPLVTDELCAAAHALGMAVVAWTVNDPAIAERVAACGVDYITTDRVEEIREVVAPV